MSKTKKQIWRKNFEIVRTHLLMGSPALFDMVKLQNVTVGKVLLDEIVWVQKGLDNIGTYVPYLKLRIFIDEIIKVIQNQPGKIRAIHKRTIELNQKYFQLNKEMLKINFARLTNNQLAELYDQLVDLEIKSHGYSLPTTWFVDSDGEDFSKELLKITSRLVKAAKLDLNPSEVFSKLSTPAKLSFSGQEELESLKVLKLIKNNNKARKIFSQKDVGKIEKSLGRLPKELHQKIKRHYKKWLWLPYTYIGPPYELRYYLEVWSGLLRQRVNIEKEMAKLKNYAKNVQKEKNKITKLLKIDRQTKEYFEIASEIIFLKAFRKDCWYFGHYIKDKFLQEVGKRLNLSLKQTWFLGWWEVLQAIRRGYFSQDTLNKRMKFCVLHQKGLSAKIYTGKRAREFLKGLNLEKKKYKKSNALQGTCAFGGKVKGIVKIVNIPDEMEKMNTGDIMVAHTTFPALVPAMKKAAAIITDDGGITCHAAIVAREMKKPCVIGTKIATKIFKDGDIVEVDAVKGIVKKIK